MDTAALIASERMHARLADLVGADDDLVIAAVTVAELRTGIELTTLRTLP